MKLATATSVLFFHTLEDAVRLVARLGYDGIDIWGGRPHVYRQDYTPDELKSLGQLIADEGLDVASFMPAFYRYPHSLSNPNSKVREDSIDYMRQCVENAALLGAPVVLVVPDHSLIGQTRADSLARMIESIDVVASHAAQVDLKLGIEVLYYDETDMVNSTDDVMAIIKELGHDNIGVVLDSGTLNLSKEPLEDILTKLGDLMLQIHVSDNAGEHEQQNLIPGDGSYDFPALFSVLKQHNYDGFVSAELTKGYALNVEPALRTTAERLRAWM